MQAASKVSSWPSSALSFATPLSGSAGVGSGRGASADPSSQHLVKKLEQVLREHAQTAKHQTVRLPNLHQVRTLPCIGMFRVFRSVR